MTSLADYIAAHQLAFAELNALSEGLDTEQLATQSLCPDWDVRSCLGHVIGVEKAMTGWTPDPANLFDFGVAVAFDEELANLDPAGVAAAIRSVTDARTADLESLDPSIVDEPSMTPVGPQAYGNFLQIRVFDMWVHARDIALPLGIDLDDGGPTAEMALNEVHRSMGYIAGKLIGLEDGMSMTVNVTGGAAPRRREYQIHEVEEAPPEDEHGHPAPGQDLQQVSSGETQFGYCVGQYDQRDNSSQRGPPESPDAVPCASPQGVFELTSHRFVRVGAQVHAAVFLVQGVQARTR